MQSEIQRYFRGVAEQYNIIPHIRFHSTVESAQWDDDAQLWEVKIKDGKTKSIKTRRAKVVVSAVGNLSIPKPCEIPGAESFQGPLFHSAQWDNSFSWDSKDVVVLGNGCSATQFVPIMAKTANKMTQFARQAHFLAERPNPVYGSAFKWMMGNVPGAMRAYRFNLYADMEKDFAGFDIETGANIREGLKEENEAFVKRMAPQKYWDALIPKHQIGCKRKVMDTDYLTTLHRPNVELITSDPVKSITSSGVRTASGQEMKADAIVLATGFEVSRMLHPMEIRGRDGMSLNEYWDAKHQGSAQAYLGTCVPGFPNFFTLMGPNTVTGHLSVIYTIECQINFVLRLLDPVLSKSYDPIPTAVSVKPESAIAHSTWLQSKLQKLVWSSGCTSWALDPKTGVNIAMHPEYQFWFWWRSVFIPSNDFNYEYVSKSGKKQRKSLEIGGVKTVRRVTIITLVVAALVGIELGVRKAGGIEAALGLLLAASTKTLAQGKEFTGL